MKKNLTYFIIIFATSIICSAKAQTNFNEEEDFFLPAKPIEHIDIRTDRNLYLSGEKVWFKAHCINEDSVTYHLSKILYVELFSHSRNTYLKHKFKIDKGISHGTIELPKNVPSDIYYLRAYTQLLKNYAPENYTTLAITIIDPLKKLPSITNDNSSNNYEIIVEDETLLDGIKSDVVLRFHNNYNEQVKGVSIINHMGRIIAKPQIIKKSIQVFSLDPSSSANYFLRLVLKNNDTIREPLAEVKQEGIAIRQNSTINGEINFDIFKKYLNSEPQHKKDYNIEILSGDKRLVLTSTIKLEEERNSFSVAKDKLENGMHLFVIKDLSGSTVAKYPFINNKLKEIPLNLSLQQTQFKQREKINLSIEALRMNHEDMANLSVTVVKKGTRDHFPLYILDDIQLLNSYCKSTNPETLTNNQIKIIQIYFGRMASHPDFTNKPYPKPVSFKWLPEIRDVSISGKLYNKETKRPILNTPIYLSVLKNNSQLHISSTKRNGDFIFSLNNLEAEQDIFLCPFYMAENNWEIKINSDFSNQYPKIQNTLLTINKSNQQLLKEMLINRQTTDLYQIIKSKQQPPLYQYETNVENPSISVLLKDFVDLNSMETVFREIIPNCLVRKREKEYTIQMADGSSSFISDAPLILIDNIPVFDINELFKIHPSKVEKIEVNPTNLILGGNIIKGLIRLKTKTNNFGGVKMPKGSTFLEYQTISPTFKFKSPSYETQDLKLDRSADFRTTLYWNSDLIFTGKSNISFYTSDHCSEYEVIVSGMDSDGKKYFGHTSFEVIQDEQFK